MRKALPVIVGVALLAFALFVVRPFPPQPEPGIAGLVRATSGERFTMGRLVGFEYAPHGRASQPSAELYGALVAIEDEIHETGGQGSPALLHARGVALLLLGKLDDAVGVLQS